MLLPGMAIDAGHGEVRIDMLAWVYEKGHQPGLSTLLAAYLGIDLDTLPQADRKRFYARTQLFRVDSEHGKIIQLQLDDGSIHTPPPTGSDGLTRLNVTVSTRLMDDQGRIHVSLLRPDGNTDKQTRSMAWFAQPQGLSIVSDIDDTIKHSQVHDKKALLRNTFLHPFRQIPEMAAYYRSFMTEHPDSDVRFYYLSSTPIQLFPLLDEFLRDNRFPAGSMHLRKATS